MGKDTQNIVIVGGVAGGASAATRARRMDEFANIVLIEKDEYVSFANCGLPYYIGEEISERDKLIVASTDFLERRFALDVRTRQEVVAIDRSAKTVSVLNHRSGQRYDQPYDKLILTPGASPFVPPLEGRDADGVYTLRNLSDTDRIKIATDGSATKRAVVIGAGFIGLEMVEQLVERGFDVALGELQPQVLPMFDAEMVQPVEEQLRSRGVKLHLGDGINRILVDDSGRACGVELSSGTELKADIVILGIGVRPNTQLAEAAGLEIGPGRGIATNRFMQTSDPDIYAAGDAAEYVYGPTGQSMRIALAGPANRAGRLAGEHAATGRSAEMADVQGTSIVRVFDTVAAMTGLTSQLADRMNVAARAVTVIANHHAGYFPGAKPLTLKLIYEPESGRVLGAQAVGQEGVDKRIDVIAAALAMKATVHDVAGFDLAYAPPFGSAKDPIHMAAFAACNQIDGVADFVAADADLRQHQVVDVRTPGEVEKRPLRGVDKSKLIPLDDLRDRLSELDASIPTVVVCASGMRAHAALRILRQHGFADVKSVVGGATIRSRAMKNKES